MRLSMKKPSQRPKVLVLVAGPLASGKSTLSKAIARKLSFVCLNKDDIKEILGDTVGYHNREENLQLSVATYQLMKHAGKRILEASAGIVLESNFRKYEYESLIDEAKQQGHSVITLFVTAHDDILYERFRQRQPSRHHVHTSVGLPDRDTFTTWISRYSDIPYDPDTIIIDTSDFSTVSVDGIVGEIINRIRGQAAITLIGQ